MMKVAFGMNRLEATQEEVLALVGQYLRASQWTKVSPVELLTEITQFYGLLVPDDTGIWKFVHKSIHDYLAARYWVEEENFAPTRVTKWDTRAAHAACLRSNATQFMIQALTFAPDMQAFAECLYNRAEFDPKQVAAAVIRRFEHSNIAYTSTNYSFLSLASESFLKALVDAGQRSIKDLGQTLGETALSELKTRV
jgi:hypothetical protein